MSTPPEADLRSLEHNIVLIGYKAANIRLLLSTPPGTKNESLGIIETLIMELEDELDELRRTYYPLIGGTAD